MAIDKHLLYAELCAFFIIMQLDTFDLNPETGGLFREAWRSACTGNQKGEVYEMASPDGFCLRYYDLTSLQPGGRTLKHTGPFVLLIYTLDGEKNCCPGDADTYAFGEFEFNYLYVPQGNVTFSWKEGVELKYFELILSPELMLELLPENHPFHERMTDNEADAPILIKGNNLSLMTKSVSVLYEVMNSFLKGECKQLYTAGKLRELLALDLNAFTRQEAASHHKLRLKPADIERMHQARKIILANLHCPCSIPDLAKRVGTNETYLKQRFKNIFGHTICNFCLKARMEKAKVLLQAGNSAGETAQLVGYEHLSHFIRAFKKHFGVSPGKIKREEV